MLRNHKKYLHLLIIYEKSPLGRAFFMTNISKEPRTVLHSSFIPVGSGKVIVEDTAIEGFSRFIMLFDLTEDIKTGNIYVSEYGTGGITLLRSKVTQGKVCNSQN
jgi:hypothetical protein